MKIIGLTGGISSGKSTVSKILESLGAIIIDADKIARRIVEPGQKSLESIVLEFGSSVLNTDGTLNRKALGGIVFNDSQKLKKLNEITHPEIKSIIKSEIDSFKKSGKDVIIVIDAAVLIEAGMDEMADEVWLVYVDYDTQIERLMQRDDISQAQAEGRIRSQLPVEDKIKKSDRIIDNSRDRYYTEQQVKKFWHVIIN